jgi:hypothetical protein
MTTATSPFDRTTDRTPALRLHDAARITEDGGDLDLDAPLTLTDYTEIILDEAVHNLEQREIEPLCSAVREKIGAIIQENRRWRPADSLEQKMTAVRTIDGGTTEPEG